MIEIPGIIEPSVTRRRLLQMGIYGVLGSALNQSQLSASSSKGNEPIRSCIVLLLYGGPSHLDTWDMKPDAPSEIRGEYHPIRTCIPGRVVCEHLPSCSQVMDKIAVIRSMHHEMVNHNKAVYEALVGRPHETAETIPGPNRILDFPNPGSILDHLKASGALEGTKNPLTHVALPHVLQNLVDLPGQNAGFLGGRYDPLQIVNDPSLPDFRVPDFSLPREVSEDRRKDRLALLESLDQGVRTAENSLAQHRKRALELLHDRNVQSAFRIDYEPARVRDRYGRHKLGQSLLLARRLVESGVRFINVHDGVTNAQDTNWDSHRTIFPRHRELLPPFDQAFSALIEDLDNRGLLESTLVIAMGEFGRSPKINSQAGRDHWPNCYSLALAGGGVEGGAVSGESDKIAAYPESNGVTPGDLAATVFWRFGVDPRHEIRDHLGRPFPIATGKPIRELFPGST